MDEVALTERLIAFDTSSREGLGRAAEFVGGWLESRDIEARQIEARGLPVTMAEVGPADAPTLVMHGHLDVVPAEAGQFEPRLEGDRLYGRGAYDMKGALAVMMLVMREAREQDLVRVRLGIVSDEESEEETDRGSDALVADGFLGDFAITGEPTNLQVGVQAKGVLAMRLGVSGRAAHGATPWLGDNAIVKAVEVYRGIESLPFARQSSELFDRPSINLGRILGGDALNRVPDLCVIDVDVRFLPEQDPEQILEQVSGLPDTRVLATFRRSPAVVEPQNAFVQGLCEAASPHHPERVMSVGRDGASDVVSFLAAGVPAVEFGPVGAGHHGPEEWVSVSSLRSYRNALQGFLGEFPGMVPSSIADSAG
jgi:succinyl-diaminopimelate desuccinylase